MKKMYLKPEIIEVEVSMTAHLMDVSMTGNDASVGDNGDYETLSREASDWDD